MSQPNMSVAESMKSSLPWLVALPDSVGDAVLATALLNRIKMHTCEKYGMVLLCADRMVPLLSDQRCVFSCIPYGPSAQKAIGDIRFEWIIDLWGTETSQALLQNVSSVKRASRSTEDHFLMEVGDYRFPAPSFNPSLGGRAANPHEPAWALEGALVAKVLGEDLWDWVDSGWEPAFHFKAPHSSITHSITAQKPYAVLLPCGHSHKYWPVEFYLELGLELRKLGLEVHVSIGPDEAMGPAIRMAESGQFVVSPPMNLRVLAAYFLGSRLVIANDCGPMHIACACGVPTVGIFGPTNSKCWFCYGGNHRRSIQTGREPDPWAGWTEGDVWHDWPSVDQVLALAKQILNDSELHPDLGDDSQFNSRIGRGFKR